MKSKTRIKIAIGLTLATLAVAFYTYENVIATDKGLVSPWKSGLSSENSAQNDQLLEYKNERTYDHGSSTTPASVEPASYIKDNLALIAVFNRQRDQRSSCVIYHENAGAFRYREGDFLPNGIALKEIHSRYVVLEKGNVQYTLSLLGSSSSGTDEHTTTTVSQGNKHEEDQESEDETIRDSRLGLIAHLNLTPVKKDSPEGYVVGEQFPKDISRMVGITPGDIVTHVNGYAVGEESNDYLAWRAFESSGFASMTILRDNQELNLYYRVNP